MRPVTPRIYLLLHCSADQLAGGAVSGFAGAVVGVVPLAAQAAAKVRKADAEAGEAVDTVKAGVEADNQRAKDAAAGSDDPLKSALDVL